MMTGRRPVVVHGALVLVQLIFGVGSVIASLGLPAFNPLVFAAIREACAGPLLLAAALWAERSRGNSCRRRRRRRVPWGAVIVLGVCIFGNQAAYILGIKFSNGVAGSLWQPSQPVLTLALSVILGREKVSGRRVAGIACAFGGCYVVLSKAVVRKTPPLLVAALAYCCATPITFVTAAVATSLAPRFACSDCAEGTYWAVPKTAIPALAYWILFQSVASYALLTWAAKHARASVVSAYSALQPVAAATLALALNAAGRATPPPRPKELLAASFVLGGLYITAATEEEEEEDVLKHPPLLLTDVELS
ncbi:hypothetical protein CTAYLR_010764 [Chrysophaeum taylorii]|uniref:EamA domain-containing protein n=1 Tax=Chrysophaeum taylorii TaxID=2483200 RepID=A0AAD7UAW0_9STRA|nr:hypothetical protein CTAYLR_010764 [Chrysophaeum taylorii]